MISCQQTYEEVKPRRNCLKTGFQYEKEVEHEVKSKNEEASTRKKKKLKEIKNEPLKTSKETGFSKQPWDKLSSKRLEEERKKTMKKKVRT